MRILVLAATAVIAFAGSAGAQIMPLTSSSPIRFSEDSQGYGKSLIETTMGNRLSSMAASGSPVHLTVAQVSLVNGSPQPAFVVKLESNETCQPGFGCEVDVFLWGGKAWSTILSTKANTIGLGVYGPSGYSSIVVDGERWNWNGTRYDIGG